MTELTNSTSEIRYHKSEVAWLVIFIVLSASCIAVIVPSFLDIVVVSGSHAAPYPVGDIVTDYISGVLWAAVLGVSILFWPVSWRDRRALLRIWVIKAFVALVLMLAYEYQYTLDPDGYFRNAISPDFTFEGFAFGNGTAVMQQLTWLHLQIIPGSFHAAKVGCALIGLLGIYLFYRAAVIFLRREDIRILYVLALFPGILFWSSTLGKDPITLFAYALYVHGVVAWNKLDRPRHFVTAVLGILIALLIRRWIVVIMIPPLAVFIIMGRRSFIWRSMVMLIYALVFTIAVTNFLEWTKITTLEGLFSLRDNVSSAYDATGGGSTFDRPEITSLNDLISNLPAGMFTALFRPLPWDVANIFGFLQGLDGLGLLLLFAMAVKRTQWKEIKEPLVLWAISLILLWAAVYGMITYNFGTLARYKVQILPVLLGLLLYLSRRRARSVRRTYMRFPLEGNVSPKSVS